MRDRVTALTWSDMGHFVACSHILPYVCYAGERESHAFLCRRGKGLLMIIDSYVQPTS